MKTVEWKDIPGYETFYQVSNQGEVRSLDRFVSNRHGGLNRRRGVQLRQATTPRGYRIVSLYRNGDVQYCSVHGLVLLAFVGPRPNGMECCHNNGGKADNALDNLRYGTHIDNMSDQVAHGTATRGERNGSAKVTEADVVAIRERRAAGEPIWRITQDYNLSGVSVGCICTGRTWPNVGGPITPAQGIGQYVRKLQSQEAA